jgi:hypothetical protein
MNTVQIAKRVLENASRDEQRRAIKYSPKTGNVYIYADAVEAGIGSILRFVNLVKCISGTSCENLLSCVNVTPKDEEESFRFALDVDPTQLITVDRSKVVIVE